LLNKFITNAMSGIVSKIH